MCVVVSKTAIRLLYNEHENTLPSDYLTVFVVYTRKFICHHVLFCLYISAWDITKSSSESGKLQHPYPRNGVKNVTHPWSKMMSPMTHRRFHVTCSHMILCVSTRKSSRSTIKITCLSHTHQYDCNLTYTETYIGLGRMWNIIDSPPGSESMLCQHIFDLNSCHSCFLVLFYTQFPCFGFQLHGKFPTRWNWHTH